MTPWTHSLARHFRGAVVLAARLKVREQALQERVPADRLRVAHQRAVPARARDRHIHAAPHKHALNAPSPYPDSSSQDVMVEKQTSGS